MASADACTTTRAMTAMERRGRLELLQRVPRELPAAIVHELLRFHTLDDLLVLEEADAAWRHAIASSDRLQHVEMRDVRDPQRTSELLRWVALRHGHRVRHLQIVTCALENETLVQIQGKFTQLATLIVSGCSTLADDGLLGLVRSSHNTITEMRAMRCPLLTDAALDGVNSCHAASLEKIDMSYCRRISSQGVVALVTGMAQLRELALKGCPKVNDVAVTSIASSCPQLQSLLLGGSGCLSDASLYALAESCHALRTLDVAQSNPFGVSRSGLTDAGVVTLLSKCQQIEHIVLRGQGRLSIAALGYLSASPMLRSLDISGCRGIVRDPLALVALLQPMTRLQRLNVSFCDGTVEENHVTSIASQCAQLKQFRVDGDVISVAPVAVAQVPTLKSGVVC